MDCHVGWFFQICAIFIRFTGVFNSRPFRIIHQDVIIQDEGHRDTPQIIYPKKIITHDDEDFVTSGSGMNIIQTSNGLKNGMISCCLLGKLAGETGSPCRMAFFASSSEKLAEKYSFAVLQRKRWRSTRHLSLISASVHLCAPGKDLMFYKCCYAAKSEKYEYRQWTRSKRFRLFRNSALQW